MYFYVIRHFSYSYVFRISYSYVFRIKKQQNEELPNGEIAAASFQVRKKIKIQL